MWVWGSVVGYGYLYLYSTYGTFRAYLGTWEPCRRRRHAPDSTNLMCFSPLDFGSNTCMYSLQLYCVGLYSKLHSFTLTTCCRALMLQYGDPHELQTNPCGQLMLHMIEIDYEIPLQSCYVCNQTWLICCAHLCQATLTHMCSIIEGWWIWARGTCKEGSYN